MHLPEFLTQAGDGEIRLTEHRIGLFHLVQHYHEGESAEMLACRYPSVPLALIHKVLAFYLENQPAVEAYIAASSTTIDQERLGASTFDWDALRRRLASQKPTVPNA